RRQALSALADILVEASDPLRVSTPPVDGEPQALLFGVRHIRLQVRLGPVRNTPTGPRLLLRGHDPAGTVTSVSADVPPRNTVLVSVPAVATVCENSPSSLQSHSPSEVRYHAGSASAGPAEKSTVRPDCSSMTTVATGSPSGSV